MLGVTVMFIDRDSSTESVFIAYVKNLDLGSIFFRYLKYSKSLSFVVTLGHCFAVHNVLTDTYTLLHFIRVLSNTYLHT